MTSAPQDPRGEAGVRRTEQAETPLAGLEVRITRDMMGIIRAVDGPIEDLLGWSPADLVGISSATLIHPEDESEAVLAWVSMLTTGARRAWRGRYRRPNGDWVWVETDNTPDTEREIISTVMRPLAGADLEAEVERQLHQQVLTKLADVLPVGVFEFDPGGRLRFTNDLLHRIVEAAPAATFEAQMGAVVPEDQPVLREAIAGALAGHPVDDVELRIALALPGGAAERVLALSMRPLIDGVGKVRGAVGCVSDVTDRTEARRLLEVKANIDSLTECLNRDAITRVLHRLMSEPDAMGKGVAVMFVDIDALKVVNDKHGHPGGDAMLVASAERLRRVVRDRDRVGRVGGDEFLVVCPDVGDPDLAVRIADRIRNAVAGPVDVRGVLEELHASVGVAWTDQPGDAEQLVAEADDAMYRAKRAARLNRRDADN